ncbi:hypothetical protein QJQ45_003474 [Haematococcus lacustris]|nr:hypothetical protein QJQ45_003474 [Haematococcus lacustris]
MLAPPIASPQGPIASPDLRHMYQLALAAIATQGQAAPAQGSELGAATPAPGFTLRKRTTPSEGLPKTAAKRKGPRDTDQLRGRVVLVDEHRTTWVSSAVNGQQPCEEELDHEQPTRLAGLKPPAEQMEHRLLRPAWSQQRDQPVRGLMWCPVVAPRKPPQAPRSSHATTQPTASEPGPSTPPPAKRNKRTKAKQEAEPPTPPRAKARHRARDCNAGLNMQRIGESRWRPLELCYWPEQGALPAKGKEYPGLGCKRV